MHKLWKICLVAGLAFAMVGCGSSEEVASDNVESEETTVEDEESGYYVTIEGVVVAIGYTLEETVACISEEPDYFEAVSCAFAGTDYIYTYNDCTVTFTDIDDEIVVGIITLTNDLVETGEGAYIGLSRDEIMEIYGEDYEGDDVAITYTKDESELQFIFDGDQVISILIQMK